MPKTITELKREYFDQLAGELEKLFPKGEKCQCGKRLPCRSKALAFNAFANIYLDEILREVICYFARPCREKQ